MGRDFPISTVPGEGGPVRRVFFRCGACDVTTSLSQFWCGSSREEAIAAFLHKRGWLVGRSPEADRCPDCARAWRLEVSARIQKRAEQSSKDRAFQTFLSEQILSSAVEDPKLNLTVIQMAKATKAASAPACAEDSSPVGTPAGPDKDARRLIYAEIDVAWLDDSKGYAGGATDRTIAAKLGVPVAWVADVREFAFGPVMMNEELAAFAADHATLVETVAALEGRHADLARELDAARKSLAAITRRAEPILKTVRP